MNQAIRFVPLDWNYSCKHMFNACTITWTKGYRMDKKQRLAALAYELKKAKLKVRLVMADMQERNSLLDKMSSLSEFGCDQCVCKAVAGRYPVAETFGEPLRDEESWKKEVGKGKTFLGRKGEAPLLQLPGFSITEGLPVDPMHQLFLGHVRNMIENFILSDKCHMGKNVKDSLLSDVNANYCNIRHPIEIHRNPRDYDKTWCSNEYKVFLLTCGHKVADIFEAHELPELAMLWGRFTFLIRALMLPNQWLIGVEQDEDLEQLMREHLEDVERLLGAGQMNPNSHALTHLIQWRRKFRFHEISCEPGEAFFGQNKRALNVKNKHYGRQVHNNRNTEYLKGHDCKNVFSYSNPRTQSSKDNSIIVDRFMKIYR